MIRKLSPFESAYVGAAPAFPPFAIQFLIESSDEIGREDLNEALVRVFAANRLAGMKLQGSSWVEGAAVIGQDISGEMPSVDSPWFHQPISLLSTPLEVFRWNGVGVLFRCSHALMDARGLLFFAEEVFRALRGEPLLGTSMELSDHEYLRRFKHAKRRGWPPFNRKSPLGPPSAGNSGFVQERRTLPGLAPAAGARLAYALARLAWEADSLARIMVPVDLRQLDTGLRSTANFSSPMIFELSRGTSWIEFYRRVLEAFARHDYRGTEPLDLLIPWLPWAVLRAIQEKAHGWQAKHDAYGLSGTVSHLGRISLASFSTVNFKPRSVFLLPFNVPGSGLTLISLQHDNALEIAASAPLSAGGGGRLAAALDRLLNYFTEKSEATEGEGAAFTVSSQGPENRTAGNVCMLSLFLERAALHPENVAVSDGARTVSYGEIEKLSYDFAASIRARGVGAGDRVAILAPHSVEVVAAVLGIMLSGAAFVPLDPEWPDERVRFILEDAGIKLVITTGMLAPKAEGWKVLDLGQPIPESSERIRCRADISYVIYTSGSTGAPKGVVVGQASLTNYLLWARKAYFCGEPPVYPLFTSLAFDLTLTSLLVPLVSGGRIRVIREREPASAVHAILQDPGINSVKLTPSHLRLFREMGVGGVRVFVVGGEPLATELAFAVAGRGRVKIFNEYGPTEATVGCVVHEYLPEADIADTVPIGTPIFNTEVLLLDEKCGPVPRGAIGEIYLSGVCLAIGYHARPDEDARFSPHPFRPGERVYRTGDRGKLQHNGVFVYVGRTDEQVKILGQRIELGEVEAALQATGQSRECAVVSQRDGENNRLVAFVNSGTNLLAVKAKLAQRLPRVALPAIYVELERLPLTPNGKVDKKRLPLPRRETPAMESGKAGSLEESLRAMVSVQLGKSSAEIPINESLHDLGFDSLQMALLLVRASQLLPESARAQVFSGLHGFLREPCLERLAEHLRGLGASG